jgi:hypothetical protein
MKRTHCVLHHFEYILDGIRTIDTTCGVSKVSFEEKN